MSWKTIVQRSLAAALCLSLFGGLSPLAWAKKNTVEKPATTLSQSTDSIENVKNIDINQSGKVSINHASAEELAQKLNGIGKQKAKAIVEYREKYGAFNSIENILEVQGIGPAFLEKNKTKLIL
ncbi:ComEA family DNA-binding protein [Providencia rettgeri]|uniref:ComEA family DNA-binding protein n=1 Tax=Providencia rettgeri TaxID=587 RepID=UPI0023AA70F6|nr:ComEA family DNA-binding protein [Providencia rettgeri]